MQENLQAIANVTIPFEMLLERQLADAVTRLTGVPVDVFAQVVFSDKANNDQPLPAICPSNRDSEEPGPHPHVDGLFHLDTRVQRMQAVHLLAGLAFDGLIDKERYFLDATVEIRRAGFSYGIKYIITVREEDGERISGESVVADNRFDLTL